MNAEHAPATGRRIIVHGTVQGVGFRPWIYHLASSLGLAGSVENGPDGVSIDAYGTREALDELVRRMRCEAPPASRIGELAWRSLPGPAPSGFAIAASRADGERRPSIPPDLAMCPACEAEIRDPSARRYRYPFTNCTHCGPRLTIATAAPYDRPNTTMDGFALCDECRREYQDPADRRFHAQPIACPTCGPRLALVDGFGEPIAAEPTAVGPVAADPIAAAAELLAGGGIVAVRGLGGFHLACDALRDDAVRELRRRKRRDEKPFAVMVPDLAAAEELAVLGDADRALLGSPARPIVLAPPRPGGLAPSVAPGCADVGLFLPYTPLHALLLAEARRPLVMTSGNLRDEPMAIDNREAIERLAGVADAFLLHDRPIAIRTDDSVARSACGAPMVLRRARGYAPEPVRVPIRFARPVLAVGGQLKNTFCLGDGDLATLSPHVGDLDDLATYESFRQMVERMELFLGLSPDVIAHDLHPDYRSTRYAEERAAGGARRIAVQHHHAHIAAVMAEHGLVGPVMGVAYDGTGLGDDGAAWGGEILLARFDRFERPATFRPLPLVGGERAVREPWRVALAALDDAFDGDAPVERAPLFRERGRIAPGDLANVRRLLRGGVHTVPAHGVGRLFDAAAALILERPTAAFEAQLAMALEQAAGAGAWRSAVPYPLAIDRAASPWQIDLRPMWRALFADVVAGAPPALLAARFHATVAAATARALAELRREHGSLPVALGGGCFQNRILTERIAAMASAGRIQVHLPRRIPPGDGGLAFGQAVVAAARLAGEGGVS